MNRSITVAAVALTAGLALSACGNDSTEAEGPTAADTSSSSDHSDHATGAPSETDASTSGHAAHQMEHPADGGPPPEGIVDATDPTYPVGTHVVLTADHMPGMDGSPATITGAFETTAYSVSYTPTDGGEPVRDHKWVVHEELADPAAAPLPDGTDVVLRAHHMAGMDGATATIDSSTQETVYMVDVQAEGMPMTNHKWVTESEIRPVP